VYLLDLLPRALALSFTCHELVAASPRLQLVAEQYHESISKKRVSHALDDPVKFLPREAFKFGTTMVRHAAMEKMKFSVFFPIYVLLTHLSETGASASHSVSIVSHSKRPSFLPPFPSS
jgi:hypothetical protein